MQLLTLDRKQLHGTMKDNECNDFIEFDRTVAEDKERNPKYIEEKSIVHHILIILLQYK